MHDEERSTDETASVSLDIEATPETVWHAITTDAGLAQWMGAGSTMGGREGDDLFVDDIVTGERRRGRVNTVEPGERVAYQWWPEESPENVSNVDITLVPCESGTRVTVTETRTPGTAFAMAPSSAPAQPAWLWRTALLMLAAQLVGAPRL